MHGWRTASVRVVQQPLWRIAQIDRHHQRPADQRRFHAAIHVPANHSTRVQVDHHCQVRPALKGPDLRDVGRPHPVLLRRCEIPVQHVLSHRLRMLTVRRQHEPFLPLHHQVQLFHQLTDPVAPNLKVFFAQLLHQLAAAQALPRLVEQRFHPMTQSPRIAVDQLTATSAPIVVGARADLHHPAQHRHRILALPFADEAVLHFISFAKKALAFFRNKKSQTISYTFSSFHNHLLS